MKIQKDTKIAAIGILILFLLSFAGCATTGGGGLFQEEVTERTVVTPARTNTSPSGAIVVTPEMIEKIFHTNVIVNPSVQHSIDAMKAANSMLNPTPSAPFVHLGLTAFGGILALIAGYKNKKNGQLADVLIAGVEAANSKEVKAIIGNLARKNGVSDLVHKRVTKLTK